MRRAYHNIIYYIKVKDKRFHNEFMLYNAFRTHFTAKNFLYRETRDYNAREADFVDLCRARVI